MGLWVDSLLKTLFTNHTENPDLGHLLSKTLFSSYALLRNV
jgi:hypothetical protein